MAEPDLTFIARQLERLLEAQAAMRDDMTVLLARTDHVERTMRSRFSTVDETLALMMAEMRGLRSRVDRNERRLERIEDQAPAP